MIVTDLDKTLLRDDSTISAYTIDTLRACREKGILVVFATARSAEAAQRMVSQYAPDALICYGGALIRMGRHILHHLPIPLDISRALLRDLLAEKSITSILAINEEIALTNNAKQLEISDSSHYRYADLSIENDNTYLKISVVADHPAAVQAIAARYPLCDLLRYTGENLYRFAHRDALKWNALRILAGHLDIDTRDIAAFGDDVNDLEMVGHCGHGVAVGNAINEVRQAARYLCASNEQDGVARWLRRCALGEADIRAAN